MNTSKHKKNKSIKWLGFGIMVVLLSIGLYQRSLITAYVDNIKRNPYKPGDRINVSGSPMENASTIPVFRLAKNESGYLEFRADIEISNDSLRKFKTTYIGKYIDYKLAPFSAYDKSKGKRIDGVVTLYKFLPDPKVIIKHDRDPLTEGFAYVDSGYYVYDVSVLGYHKNSF